MVSSFMNCLGFSHFPRDTFFFVLSGSIYRVFFLSFAVRILLDFFAHILLCILINSILFFLVLSVFSVLWLLLLLLLSNSFFLFLLLLLFFLLFHQRCWSTSLPNSNECFYVPWSWTDHLPRRNKRHRKQS